MERISSAHEQIWVEQWEWLEEITLLHLKWKANKKSVVNRKFRREILYNKQTYFLQLVVVMW